VVFQLFCQERKWNESSLEINKRNLLFRPTQSTAEREMGRFFDWICQKQSSSQSHQHSSLFTLFGSCRQTPRKIFA